MSQARKTRPGKILTSRAYVWIDRREVHRLAADLIVLPNLTFSCVSFALAAIPAELP